MKIMSVKEFVVILGLSVVLMYASSLADALFNNTLLGGKSGFPFKDSSTTIFGGGTTNYFLTFLNIVFWFLILLGVWKLFLHFKKSSKK
jgi:uncharacterized membrane protein YjgN (DUF898 family)